MGQFTVNGITYEELPNGKARIVALGGPMAGAVPIGGSDPKLPGALQGQALGNTKTALDITNNPINVANTKTNIAQGQNSIRQSGIGNVQELRKEFNALPEVKNYSEYLTQMSKAVRAADTPQGDLSVIYAFAKAMDPGSVVREGEMDMANSTSSIIQDIARKYGRITAGNRLPPEVRHGLVESVRSAGHGFADSYAQQYRRYAEQAHVLGADPIQVVGHHLGDAFRPLEEKYIKDAVAAGRHVAPAVGDPTTEADLDENGNPLPALVGGSVGDPAKAALQQRINGTDAFGAGMVGAADSMTFGLADEAAAGMNALGGSLSGKGSFGDLYGQNLKTERGYQDALRERNPYATLGGNVLGAVGGMGGLNAGLRLSGRLAPIATGAGGVGSDMLYGAGYGTGSENDSRLMGAAKGAGAAAAGNIFGRAVIAPAIRGGGRALGFNPAPALPPGESMIAGQIAKGGPQDILGNLQQASELKLPYALADADPRLRALTGSAVRKSPNAFALASETIGPRAAGQAERALGLIDSHLAKPGDISQITADATKRARGASKDLYGQAMQHEPPVDQELSEILRTPAGEQAARSAYSRALNAGEKPGDLSFDVDSITGEPRLTGNPNWRTLQYMKFELDHAAKSDPSLAPLSNRLTGRLGALNPDFKAANAKYAGIASQGDAAQAGYGATGPRVTPAQTQGALAALKPGQAPFYQQGYASSLADTVERGNLSRDPYEMIYGSPAQQQKLGMVFPQGAPKFGQARGLEKDMSLTARELLGGSPTQPRAEADKQFEAGGLLGDVAELGLGVATGTPPINLMRSKLFAGRGVARGIKDAYQWGTKSSATEKADQIAPILLNQNPDETAAALADLIRRDAMRRAYVQKTGMFGSAIGAPAALGFSNR